MSHSFNKIWINAIWATKKKAPLIHPTIEYKIRKIAHGLNRGLLFQPWAMVETVG